MTVELHGAWCWTCEDCGTDNFERAIEGDATEAAMVLAQDGETVARLVAEEEAIEFDENDMAHSPALISSILIAPSRVTCKQCNVTHQTEVPLCEGEGEGEEEE